MHILHVSPYYPPAWAFGSTPAAVAALARTQGALGHQVTVLTTDAMAPHERVTPGDAIVDGVRVVRVRNMSGATRTWLGCSTPIGMRRAARRLVADAVDVVHLHELVTVENLRVVPVVDGRVPIVASLHRQLLHAHVTRRVARAWRAAGGAAVCARLRALVAASSEEAAHARTLAAWLGSTAFHPIVVPEGVDAGLPWDGGLGPAKTGPSLVSRGDSTARLPETGLSQIEEAGYPPVPDSAPRELWGAGFSRHHGAARVVVVDGRTDDADAVRTIVRAFGTIRDRADAPQLIVTGPENPAVKAAREAAYMLGLAERVQCAGYVPPSRMRHLLDAATLLVLPEGSRAGEGVVTDALARGVVVLAAGAAPSFESSAVLHVSGGDWTRAAQRALDDIDPLRDAAVASVAPLLWPAVAQRWLHLYEGLIGKTAASSGAY